MIEWEKKELSGISQKQPALDNLIGKGVYLLTLPKGLACGIEGTE